MPASEQAIPKTQRQWQHAQAGLPKDALRLIQEAAVPSPSAGEVLVRITHVTPMPSSWKAMRILPGFLRKGSVPEMEGSGVVVDPGDSEFRKGHEVMGLVTPFDHLRNARGCLSEYALFKAEHLFPIPSNLSLATATGLLSSGMTAYKALVEVGNVKIGTRLFINGGTTACGMAAIQIAKILGAGHIVVSCSSPSFELVKEMGADEAIDYKLAPLATQLSSRFQSTPFDVIMDCVGSHSLFAASPTFLNPSGIFTTIAVDVPHEASWLQAACIFAQTAGDTLRPVWMGGTPRKFVFFSTPPEHHRMVDTVRWAGEGKLKVPIDSIHPADQEGVLAAYDRSMSGRAKGKILIEFAQAK